MAVLCKARNDTEQTFWPLFMYIL